MVILLMGVTGVGKTTIGRALAEQLGLSFVDADDYHPARNVAKMRAGIPLDDADRAPWLAALREAILRWIAAKQSVILACSALKESYRRELMAGPDVRLVYLHADFDVLAERLDSRHGHYMNPKLLQSQFDALEVPRNAIVVDASKSVSEAVGAIRTALAV